jgi:hypothetical protein
MEDVWWRPLGSIVVSGVPALAAGETVAAMVAGCGGGSSANGLPAARVKMASFSGDGLSFRYPVTWTAKQSPLWETSDETTIT